ncbi:MAG: mechanosensitive ion channel [Magnetococcales bacterium]|nr:mechanosensitive ion channel [Magnetococcales bacterium]
MRFSPPVSWLFTLTVVAFFLLLSSLSMPGPVQAEEELPLHRMSNEALISHMKALHDKVESTLKSDQRLLRTNLEKLLKVQEQRAALSAALPATDVVQESSIQAIEVGMTALEQRIQNNLQQKGIIHNERALWQEREQLIQNLTTLLEGWIQLRPQIDLGLLELKFRVDDKSLRRWTIPKYLNSKDFNGRQRRYKRVQKKLQEENATVQEKLKTLQALQIQNDDQQRQAQAKLDLLKQQQERLRKQASLKQNFGQLSPKEQLNQLSQLEAETTWRMGSFLLNNSQHIQLQKQVEELEQALEKLQIPKIDQAEQETVAYDLVRAEAHSKKLQQRNDILEERLEQQKMLASTMNLLLERGQKVVEQNSSIADRLVDMRVLIALLNKHPDTKEKLPPGSSLAKLDTIGEKSAKQTAHIVAAMAEAELRLPELEQRIETEMAALAEAQADRIAFSRLLKHARQRHDQSNHLRQLETEAILESIAVAEESFTQSSGKLKTSRSQLSSMRQLTLRGIRDLETAQDVFSAFLHNAQGQRHQLIRNQLYQQAGMTPLADPSRPVNQASTISETVRSPVYAILDQWGDQPGDVLEGVGLELKQLQALLVSRIQLLNDQKEQETRIVKLLTRENDALAQHIHLIEQTLSATQTSFAGAIELQKRLGRGEMQPDQAPTHLGKLLDSDRIAPLESELARFSALKSEVEAQITFYSDPDKARYATIQPLGELQALLDVRINLLDGWLRLIEKNTAKLSELDQKNLEQDARRRLLSSESGLESFLNLFVSSQGKKLTDMLQALHIEVLELEMTRENLAEQKKAADRLLRLNDSEGPILTELTDMFEQAHARLSQQWSEQNARLNASQKTTGTESEPRSEFAAPSEESQTLLESLGTQEEQRAELDRRAKNLFDLYIHKTVAETWLTLLKVRHSRFGMVAEAGIYRNRNRALTVERNSLLSQIERLDGISPERQRELDASLDALSPMERQQRIEGKINLTRQDRLKIQRKTAIWAGLKLAIILLLAWVTRQLVELLVWRRMEKKADRNIPNLMRGLVTFLIFLFAFFAVVAFVFGQTLTGLLATSGLMAMIIGLAVQMNIANIFSGLAINLERPFQIGDEVKLDSTTGKVVDITWRTTRILTMCQELVTVPNNIAAESVVMNYSQPDENYWKGFNVYLPQEADPDEMEALFYAAMKDIDAIKTPWVMFMGFNEWAAEYMVWFMIPYSKRWGVPNQLWKNIWEAFRVKGIKPVFKQFHHMPPE